LVRPKLSFLFAKLDFWQRRERGREPSSQRGWKTIP